jgi:hypothetical protein
LFVYAHSAQLVHPVYMPLCMNAELSKVEVAAVTCVQRSCVLSSSSCAACLLAVLRRAQVNAELTAELGIPQAAAVTCVKPSGTVSQLVDSASGIHPRHSEYYIRRVRCNKVGNAVCNTQVLCMHLFSQLLCGGIHVDDGSPSWATVIWLGLLAPTSVCCGGWGKQCSCMMLYMRARRLLLP